MGLVVIAAVFSHSDRGGADTHYQRAKQLLVQRGSKLNAIQHLRKALAVQPDHADSAHWLAHSLFTTGSTHFAESRDLLARVRVEDLRDTAPLDTIRLRAQAHEKLGET